MYFIIFTVYRPVHLLKNSKPQEKKTFGVISDGK